MLEPTTYDPAQLFQHYIYSQPAYEACFTVGDAVPEQPCVYGMDVPDPADPNRRIDVPWPDKPTCTTELVQAAGTSFPNIDAEALVTTSSGSVVPAWTLFKYWIGAWRDAMATTTSGMLVPRWPTKGLAWTDNLMVPIAMRSSVHPTLADGTPSPFSACMLPASASSNPRTQGFNHNTGLNSHLLYLIESDNTMLSKVWHVPPRLSGTCKAYTMTMAHHQFGVVDGWGFAPPHNAPRLPCTTAAGRMQSIIADDSSDFLLVAQWQDAAFARLATTAKASSGAACTAAGMGAAAAVPTPHTPFTSYTCAHVGDKANVAVTPEMQAPYCVNQCGGKAATFSTMVVPGTCSPMASNVCGCMCLAGCNGCPSTLGRPGMVMGMDLYLGRAAAVLAAKAVPAWVPIVDAIWGTPWAERLYNHDGNGAGTSGGYTFGLPTFSAVGASSFTPVVEHEGGIMDASVTGDLAELHDDFAEGIQAQNWGVLTKKGSGPWLGATVGRADGSAVPVPLVDMTADVVRTYRCPNTAGAKKPVVCLRSISKNGVLTMAGNLTTARWWGSGYYEVTAKFPRAQGGVNAIWTFHGHTSGAWANPQSCTSDAAPACAGTEPTTAAAPWAVPFGVGLGPDTHPARNVMPVPLGPDALNNLTLLRNDEIDIELPTNSQMSACVNGVAPAGTTGSAMGWNTTNCNTYQYTGGGGDGQIPYVNMPILSDEAVVDGENYHVYGFQWVTGHMGSGKAGRAPVPSNPATWEQEPHVNWYLDGAYMGTVNAFVPTRYSRLTIGFIVTGNNGWHGTTADWGDSEVACAYVSEVNIVPFHNDRDSWWPMTMDQPINLRYTAAALGSQLWLPLAYAMYKHWQGAQGAAHQIAPTDPYWGKLNFYGAYCTPTGPQLVCKTAWDAWKTSLGAAPDCTFGGLAPCVLGNGAAAARFCARKSAWYDAALKRNGWDPRCTAGLYYQCPNLPREPSTIPPRCRGLSGSPAQSQLTSCGTATGPGVAAAGATGEAADPTCPAQHTAGCSANIGSLVAPCSGTSATDTGDADCYAALAKACPSIDATKCAKGSCPGAHGTVSAYCQYWHGKTCKFKTAASGGGGAVPPPGSIAAQCPVAPPPPPLCTDTVSEVSPTAGCSIDLVHQPPTLCCGGATAAEATKICEHKLMDTYCADAKLTCTDGTCVAHAEGNDMAITTYCNKLSGGSCHIRVSGDTMA